MCHIKRAEGPPITLKISLLKLFMQSISIDIGRIIKDLPLLAWVGIPQFMKNPNAMHETPLLCPLVWFAHPSS